MKPAGSVEFIIKDHYAEPGKPGGVNEDHMTILRDQRGCITAVAVWDGATSFGTQYIPPEISGGSDARWFVEHAGAALEKLYDTRIPMKRLLKAVARQVKAEFDALNISGLPPAHLLPFSVLSLIELGERTVRISQLADAPVIVSDFPNPRFITADSRVEEEYLALLRQHRAAGMTSHGEILERMKPQIAADRARINSGFDENGKARWAEALTLSGPGKLTVTNIQHRPGMELLAMTDGLSRIIDPYKAYTPHGFMNFVEMYGLQSAAQVVRDFEACDPNCERVPRVKPQDDILGVRLKVIARPAPDNPGSRITRSLSSAIGGGGCPG